MSLLRNCSLTPLKYLLVCYWLWPEHMDLRIGAVFQCGPNTKVFPQPSLPPKNWWLSFYFLLEGIHSTWAQYIC